MRLYDYLDIRFQELRNAVSQNLQEPPEDPMSGLFYFNTDTKRWYIFDGEKWVDCTLQLIDFSCSITGITYNPETGEFSLDEGYVIPTLQQFQDLWDAIATETQARIDADTILQQNIDAEELARINADNTLQQNIDNEETARINADSTLQDNIDAEEQARINADSTLQDNIDAEELARTNADNTLQDNIDAEETARINADNTLQGNIDIETQNRTTADTLMQNSITALQNLVPSEANPANKLADKNFVLSEIQTFGASFRGSWATWSAVPTDAGLYPKDSSGNRTPDKNDYMIVIADETKDGGTWKYVYTGTWSEEGKSGWKAEYQIEKTPLTPAQQAALDSGITSSKVAQITTNANDIVTINNTLSHKIELTDLSSNATGLNYNNNNGVFSLENGYVIPTQTTLDNIQRNFTFAELGITKTTHQYSTIDLAKEIAGKNLTPSTVLFGEVRLNDMPSGIGNAELKVQVQDRQGIASVLGFTLSSTNVSPHEWDFYWVGTAATGSPTTCTWYPRVMEADIGNGTITLIQGNETKGSFTVNQSGDTTITLDQGGGSVGIPELDGGVASSVYVIGQNLDCGDAQD